MTYGFAGRVKAVDTAAGTLTRNSAWPNRTGNSDGDNADVTLASMPCASSNPRTTSVSIDE